MIQKRLIFAISIFVFQLSIKTVSGQETFVHDQELIGEGTDDLFGWSVDLSGDGMTIIVGAIGNNGGFTNQGNKGQARVYRNTLNVSFNSWSWVMLGAEINGTAASVESGYDVSINYDGNTIAIGTPGQNKMRVYDLNISDNWSQRGNDLTIFASENPQRAGHSISINADATVAAMGAPSANKVWVFDIDPNGGIGHLSGNPLVGASIEHRLAACCSVTKTDHLTARALQSDVSSIVACAGVVHPKRLGAVGFSLPHHLKAPHFIFNLQAPEVDARCQAAHVNLPFSIL